MSDLITLQGVVLSAMPMGEYDRRIVLLTRERGKISAFAKGARRMNSPFLAATGPFVFGSFTLYEGRTSYTLNQVSITRHFAELAGMQPGVYYGYYFLEIADYFGREGTDEKAMMNLLYISIKALLNPSIDDRLVRCVFELRTMTEQGMMPRLFACAACEKQVSQEESWYFSQNAHGVLCGDCARHYTGGSPGPGVSRSDLRPVSFGTLRVLQYIAAAPMERLYTFMVDGETLGEVERIVHTYFQRGTDRKFKSLQILEVMALPEAH